MTSLMRILPLVLCCWLAVPRVAAAEEYRDDWKFKLEGSGSYEFGSGDYGHWAGLDTALYIRNASQKLTFMLNGAGWYRSNHWAGIGALGLWADAHKKMYTYTSLALGSNDEYNPLFRGDHQFNIKLGAKEKFVLTVAATFMYYHTGNYDIMPYLGVTAYLKGVSLTYWALLNIALPNSTVSLSHRLGADIGAEGRHITYINVLVGQAAYTLSYSGESDEEVRSAAVSALIGHRHWISDAWGLYGQANYLYYQDHWHKFGVLFGAFVEWGRPPTPTAQP